MNNVSSRLLISFLLCKEQTLSYRCEVTLKLRMKAIQNLLLFALLLTVSVRSQTSGAQEKGISDAFFYAQTLSRLSSLNQQIKTVDSAALRASLRLKISDFIWRNKIVEGQSLAENVIVEALEDFQKNKTEIPAPYQDLFQADALALLRVNAPTLYKKISARGGLEKGNSLQSYKLVTEHGETGAAKAIADVKNRLIAANDPANINAIIFIIQELLTQNRVLEVNSILETVLASQGQAGTFSPQLLLFLNGNFLSQTTPIDLQKRFLTVVIANGQQLLLQLNAGNENRANYQSIYTVLNSNLPQVQKLLPSEYPQVLALVNALQKKLPQHDKEQEEIAERIKHSKDKLAQIISEAKSAKSQKTANDLWRQAARLALSEKKYQVAVNCVHSIESDDINSELWHDQFLDIEVAKAAIENKDVESAEYAISKIKSKLRSGTALLQIVKHHYENKDTVQTQSTLMEALKRIRAADNDVQKARGLSEALSAALVVDNNQVYEITQSFIKTVNALPTPNIEDKPESETRKQFVKDIQLPLAINILRVFQSLAKQDGSLAQSFTSDLPGDYRITGLLGIEIGSFVAATNLKPTIVKREPVKD